MNDKIALMVRNNATWIDKAVSALGIPGTFTPILYQNFNDMPPIFPNADTLGGTVSEKMAAIEALVAGRAGRVVAVKDAWAELDLTSLGFKVLFQAQWLYREAAPIPSPGGELTITPITTPEDLRAFALALNGPDISVEVYSPALLNTPDIAWLAGRAASTGEIIAGAMAVRANGINGINNVFGASAAHKQQMIAAAVMAFPDLPASDYTGEDEVEMYLPLGFERAGKLQVWIRIPQP